MSLATIALVDGHIACRRSHFYDSHVGVRPGNVSRRPFAVRIKHAPPVPTPIAGTHDAPTSGPLGRLHPPGHTSRVTLWSSQTTFKDTSQPTPVPHARGPCDLRVLLLSEGNVVEGAPGPPLRGGGASNKENVTARVVSKQVGGALFRAPKRLIARL